MLKGSSKIIPKKPIIDDIFAENDLGLHLFNIIETFAVYFNVNRFITPEYKVRIYEIHQTVLVNPLRRVTMHQGSTHRQVRGLIGPS